MVVRIEAVVDLPTRPATYDPTCAAIAGTRRRNGVFVVKAARVRRQDTLAVAEHDAVFLIREGPPASICRSVTMACFGNCAESTVVCDGSEPVDAVSRQLPARGSLFSLSLPCNTCGGSACDATAEVFAAGLWESSPLFPQSLNTQESATINPQNHALFTKPVPALNPKI